MIMWMTIILILAFVVVSYKIIKNHRTIRSGYSCEKTRSERIAEHVELFKSQSQLKGD